MEGVITMTKQNQYDELNRSLTAERFGVIRHAAVSAMPIPHTNVTVLDTLKQIDVAQMFRNLGAAPSWEVAELNVTNAIRLLEEQITVLGRINSELRTEKQELINQLEDKQEQIDFWDKSNDELRDQNDLLQDQLSFRNTQLSEQRIQNTELKFEVEEVREAHDTLQYALREANKDLDRLHSYVGETRGQSKTEDLTLRTYKAENEQLKQSHSNLVKENGRLIEENGALQGTVHRLGDRVEELLADIEDREKKDFTATQLVAALKAQREDS